MQARWEMRYSRRTAAPPVRSAPSAKILTLRAVSLYSSVPMMISVLFPQNASFGLKCLIPYILILNRCQSLLWEKTCIRTGNRPLSACLETRSYLPPIFTRKQSLLFEECQRHRIESSVMYGCQASFICVVNCDFKPLSQIIVGQVGLFDVAYCVIQENTWGNSLVEHGDQIN